MNMKKLLSLLLIVTMLCSVCACAYVPTLPDKTVLEETVSEETATEAVESIQEDTSKDYSGGKPWIDSDLKENITADMETSPKDDFHLYISSQKLDQLGSELLFS